MVFHCCHHAHIVFLLLFLVYVVGILVLDIEAGLVLQSALYLHLLGRRRAAAASHGTRGIGGARPP